MSYCTAADVATHLRLVTQSTDLTTQRLVFSTATEPSLAEVNSWIAEAKDDIDRVTRTTYGTAGTAVEVHSIRTPYRNTGGDRSIMLSRSNVTAFSVDDGDKLERWNGTEWEDISDDDGWWMDSRGIIHMRSAWLPTYYSPVRTIPTETTYRVTYRYGGDTVPGDIKRLCTMMVARRYIEGDFYRKGLPGMSGEGISPMTILTRMDEQIERILDRHRGMSVVTL